MSRLIPPSFEPFLHSLSFQPPTREARGIAYLWGDGQAKTEYGDSFLKKGVALYQAEPTEVTAAGFRKKLLHILRDAKHVASEAVVDAILGCAIKAASSGQERAAFLEDLLQRFAPAEASHFFVLPTSATTEPMTVDGYTLGAVNLPVLISRSNRAQSNFAQLYGRQLEGRFTLQSPEFRHVVIDLLKPSSELGLLNNKAWRDLLLNYFERISRQHFEFMWTHLNRTQVLASPFGANLLDVHNLRSELGKFAHRITIYLAFSRAGAGYVVPEEGSITINQPGPDSEAYTRFVDHRATYRLSDVGDSELGRTLFECSGFCQQANRFLESGRADDAALYATICLEHLFSEKQSTAEAVCTRTAALTHLRMADSFKEAEKELRKLYDARSAFVHSGESVTPAQAERLIAYARETLRSLLVLHFNIENRSQGFLEKWVKELDFIVAGFEAGRSFEGSLLADCGIFRS